MRLTSQQICSHCFTAESSECVDFEVFWDGPMLTDSDGVPTSSIDDLFLCRPCLAEGASLMGFGDVSKERAELEVLKAEVVKLRKERVEAARRLDAVDTALSGRQTARKTPRKPKVQDA